MPVSPKPPVIILGGSQNALSITRSIGRIGIRVYLSVGENRHALYSKYVYRSFPYYDKKKVLEFWEELLIEKNHDFLKGSVLFPCNDDAIQFVALKNSVLREDYILDDSVPEIQLTLLDKKRSLIKAKKMGIHIPRFWEIENLRELEEIIKDIQFPVIIKPIHSHLFQKYFSGKKYFFVKNINDLYYYLKQTINQNIQVIISEFIPGPDSLLGSYYTYIDSTGKPLFHYTKKIIRRFPENEGLACYHKTEWDEEIASLGLHFFQDLNFKGLGNVEFKRDLRDGQLKLIECNPRFTAAQELLVKSGMDISILIYNHLVGLPLPHVNSYKQNLYFWYPVRDFRAFLELKEKKQITLFQWIKSLFHKKVLPYFQISDILPSIKPIINSILNRLHK